MPLPAGRLRQSGVAASAGRPHVPKTAMHPASTALRSKPFRRPSACPVLIPLLLLAVVLPAPAADVTTFGTRGDGAADDTAALQRAVDAGGAVDLPRGIYRITQTVVVDLDRTGFVALQGGGVARVVMAGPGPAFRFVGTHEGSADPGQFKPNVWARQRAPMVDGLEIVGAHPEADGLEAAGTMQFTVTRALLRELRHGIRLAGRNRNVLIADSHIYRCRGIGIFYDQVNLHQSNITGCHISYCAGGGIVSRGGNVRNVHIGNCDIESNMARDAPATANILLDSAGGSIGEVAITGCTIQHNSHGPDSANIRLLGRGHEPALEKRVGTAATMEGHVTITGNVLSDVQVNIHLQQARGVTITGNTFWMAYQHDLLVEDSSNVVVGANSLDRNPRYNYGTSQETRGGVVFRRSRDCTVNGLHVNGAWRHPAAVLLEDCDRMNVASCTILDSDGIGLLLQGTSRSRVSGCLIRDDRPTRADAPSLAVRGGRDNWVLHNLLSHAAEIPADAAVAAGNRTGR